MNLLQIMRYLKKNGKFKRDIDGSLILKEKFKEKEGIHSALEIWDN